MNQRRHVPSSILAHYDLCAHHWRPIHALPTVLCAPPPPEPSHLDHDSQALLQTALAYRRLLAAYSTLERLEAAPPPYQQPEDDISTAVGAAVKSILSREKRCLMLEGDRTVRKSGWWFCKRL